MATCKGNMSEIYTCDDIIKCCSESEGKKLNSTIMNQMDDLHNEKIVKYYNDLFDVWKKSNYDLSSFEWINYYPDINYPNLLTDRFAQEYNLIPKRDWISEIKPGKTAPYHWDIDDNHAKWEKEGDLIRYSVFIGKSSFGHILCFDNDFYCNEEQGLVVLWDHYTDYHGAANCGIESFYLYHCLGIKA
jgi:hypothetical protein